MSLPFSCVHCTVTVSFQDSSRSPAWLLRLCSRALLSSLPAPHHMAGACALSTMLLRAP